MCSPEDCPETWHCSVRAVCHLPSLFTCGLVPSACAGLWEEATPPCHGPSVGRWSPDEECWVRPSGLLQWQSHFTAAWLRGALLQGDFRVLSFLRKVFVKLNDFKEQLLRITEEIHESVPWNRQATCCCPQTGTVWALARRQWHGSI